MLSHFFELLPQEALENSKNIDLKIRSVSAHEAIDAVLSKTVLRGGKRLRPLLTYLVANLFEINTKQITPYARATELVHAASLSHDDVIDNATLRRGSASINILASNKKAVLAGDYLLSAVIVDLSHAGHLGLVKEMSLVIKDLSEGEWLQLDLISSRNYTRELIREVAMKKTSSVMSYCALAPATLWNKNESTIKLCREFGESLGLAFQLIDDTLDFSENSDKDIGLDLDNGIVNSVVYELLDERRDLFERFKNGEHLKVLIESLPMSSYVEKINTEATMHLDHAKKILTKIQVDLASQYLNREVELNERIKSLELIVDFMGMRNH
jgi:geranylgeranyl pyrophosphate synthase